MTTDRALGGLPSMPEGRSPMGGAGVAPEGQGRLVGRRYRLLSPVGRGGMGMVWHAHDVLLDRDVAVKELILPFGLDHAGKQVAHRRMLREARSAARLSHPGIVTVHDVVEEDGRPWIVMELVRAWSLEQAVRQSGPLPVVQAAEIGVRVLDALRHAHAAGILHRDVKPGNVLLTADRVVLTDFGIAAIEGDVTITQTGLLMGSPAYIPPERLQGRPITHAADLWSFGATLYAAVEGRPPYEGPDAVAVLGAVLTQEPNRPQRAGALLPVVEGLLRKNPADRMPAAQAADLLERVLRSHGSGLLIRDGERPLTAPLPTRGASAPANMLPPLDPPSGPMPSRIIETPSGPVRVPSHPEAGYDALDGATDGQRGTYDAQRGSSGPQASSYEAPRGASGAQPNPYDALRSPSGPQPADPYDALRSSSGAQADPYDGLRSTSEPQRSPFDAFRSASGPQPADPYDALRSSSGPQSGDYDALGSASGPQRYDALGSGSGPQASPYDALRGSSGPQPSPYDALRSTSGPQANPYDALRSPSGPQANPYDALRSTSGPQAGSYDAFRSASGPQSGSYDALRSASGSQADRYEALRKPAESRPGARFDAPGAPRSPRDSLVAGTPDSRVWPDSTSPDLADRLAKDIAGDDPFGPRRKPPGARRSDEPDAPRRRAAPLDDDAREGRSPVLLVLAGVGIVGVVAALLFFLWPTSSTPSDETAAPPATGGPAASGPADPPASAQPEVTPATTEIPSGFKARTGAGASIAVPQDWTVSASNQAVTYLGPKSSGRRVQVRKVAATNDDGLDALTKAKDEATLTDYAQIRLESSSFGDGSWRSSVWEYTYTALNNVTTHAVTRHITVDGNTAYEVTFTAPDAEWDQPDTRQTMSVIWNSFKPA
ncbi:serine/threonine-protein kinase [Sphaerisporangium album]|uniref:serine/threonine-protein kinase n=1 Tax=Sphaerisporangium album TaxID=509200 RepID=UPI001FEA5303|nr:serine/threonine-protein kinase [Sphaerisporangium album]